MPGYFLEQTSSLLCAHGGTATPAMTSARVKVNGVGVVLQSATYSISGCANPPPPNGVGPCTTAGFTTAALRVKVEGQAVLLADSVSMGTPTPAPLSIISTQVRVRGI